jgi:hypothetical protein
MGNTRSNLLGTDASANANSGADSDVLGGGDTPGTLGISDPVAMSTDTIEYVSKDWDADNPKDTTPSVVIKGKTIDDVYNTLKRMGEWGRGGGQLTMTPVRDFSKSHTVTLSANLVYQMPQWTGYDSAPAAEKQVWNRMYRKLTDHEQRHVAIAVEEAEKLASALIGQTIAQGQKATTAANRTMSARQQKLDADTHHGAKEGVEYGDVILDLSKL